MNCASFEAKLVELITTADEEAGRAAGIARLREHAAACRACAGCEDLLDWLALPAAERDPVEEPDELYWTRFETRLRERIRREQAASRRSRLRMWGLAAAAGLAGLMLVALWALRPGGAVRVASGEPPPDAVEPLPSPLAERLARTDPTRALAELEFLVGEPEAWDVEPGLSPEQGDAEPDGGWLFPSTDDLDAEGRRKLLEWLREQEAQLRGGSV